VLIVVALVLILHSRRGDDGRSLLTIEKPNIRKVLVQGFRKLPSSGRKWSMGTKTKSQLTYQTQPIDVPNIGSIIIGKLSADDTSWVSAELAE